MDISLQNKFDLKFFYDNGFKRKSCQLCGVHFWTIDDDSLYCGDQPCVEFSFINNPISKKTFTIPKVREAFLSFFERNNHRRIDYPETGDRCPVVARWRTDIYLTIASIACFQPHVTSGLVPPPANPLVISQPCIRLNDLEEVGVSGRHLTMFEMMGHHAFNRCKDEIYWKEETVAYCDDFFSNIIGIPREAIIYKEQLWDGGGNAGPCLEVLAGGLEIATLVFMNLKENEKGKFVIKGRKYSQNPLNIVDTGYGLERIAWVTQGTPTIYETVYPRIFRFLKQHSTEISDIPSIYSLCDHSKCLAFMLGDGIVPSNVKAGYLARLIIRRALRFLQKLNLSISLRELVDMQLESLEKDFPSLNEKRTQIDEILDLETKRFSETLSKGENLIIRILKEQRTISKNELINLYDTHGIPPDVVQKIANQRGVSISVPENFDSIIADLHSHEKKETKDRDIHLTLPTSMLLYNTDHYMRVFNASVVWSRETNGGTEVVLDKTAFYPEGGGQPCDTGYLYTDEKKFFVKRVMKKGNSIIHVIDGVLDVNDKVHGEIDWDRRYTLMKHHTGTHLVNGALRKILGKHIWQAGSQLGINEARFDFSHYKPLSENERSEIEDLTNEFIKREIVVEKKLMDRNSAEQKYGFRLYQGGVPSGNTILVLNIPDIDVEACGGTHLNNTKEVEKIRITRTERIQDGVNRVVFAAGRRADAYQKEEKNLYDRIIKSMSSYYIIKNHDNFSTQLQEATKIFSVSILQLEKSIQRFINEINWQPKGKTEVSDLKEACKHLFKEWKLTKKMIKQKSVEYSQRAELRKEKQVMIKGKPVILVFEDIPPTYNPTAVAGEITKQNGYIAYVSSGNRVTLAASEDVNIDLRSIAKEVGKVLGGSGGGKPHMAQSGGVKSGNSSEALKKAEELICE